MRSICLFLLLLGCAQTPYQKAVRAMNDTQICDQVRDRGQHGLLSAEEAETLAIEMDRRGILGKECLYGPSR